MKATQRAALEAFIVATIVAGLIAWFILPGAVWLVHLVVWLAAAAGAYKTRLAMLADAALADSTKP